jgi:8-oxo-dGTP pyrophosphatase MutT (NUDIX family)
MPVIPRDAASLVLLRGTPDKPEVLMGRRNENLRFMPGYYVFPGGTVDDTDDAVSQGLSLHPETMKSLARHAAPERQGALVWAALREAWEEAEVFFGAPDGQWNIRTGQCAAADAYRAEGLTPGAERMAFIARAVTPRESPMRFDSRFFLADAGPKGDHVSGTPRATGELEDVAWHRAEMVIATYPMANITRFVLCRALAIWCAGSPNGGPFEPSDRSIPCFTQRNRTFAMAEDNPGDPPQIDPESLKWPDQG